MKKREFLVKGYILFCACWLVCVIVALAIADIKNNLLWERIALLAFAILVVLVGIMLFLMSKVDVSSKTVKPEETKLLLDKFDAFDREFFWQAGLHGFHDAGVHKISDCVTVHLGYRETLETVYVLETVWMDEFCDENIETAIEYFWDETVKRIGEKEIVNASVALIQCICTGRVNTEFKEFVTQNVPQDYKRNQLIVAAAFDEKRGYICQTKGRCNRDVINDLKDILAYLTGNLFDRAET